MRREAVRRPIGKATEHLTEHPARFRRTFSKHLMAAVEHYTPSSQAGLLRRISRLLCSRPFLFLAFGGAAAITNLATGRLLYGPGLGVWIPHWCATAIAAATGLVANFAGHFLAVGLVAFYSYPAHRFLSFNIGIRARLLQARRLFTE